MINRWWMNWSWLRVYKNSRAALRVDAKWFFILTVQNHNSYVIATAGRNDVDGGGWNCKGLLEFPHNKPLQNNPTAIFCWWSSFLYNSLISPEWIAERIQIMSIAKCRQLHNFTKAMLAPYQMKFQADKSFSPPSSFNWFPLNEWLISTKSL